MRRLVQPGPVQERRIDSFGGTPRALTFTVRPGLTLNEALTRPMVEAGFQCGTIVLEDGTLSPFRYVMPGPADDASHVAYFSAPRAPAGETRLARANATFGWIGDTPSVHCHAAWTEADGARRGGHILPHDTVVACETTALAWGFDDVRIAAAPDPETNFTLFQPHGRAAAATRGIVARVRPNEDIVLAVEAIARSHGLADAVVRGSLGSLVGARFTEGTGVPDDATEVLVREGHVRDGVATLDLLVVDGAGRVHEGRLARGENAVCITFDLFIEAAG